MVKYEVFVKKIIWIDEEGLEAEVLFEIEGQQLWAFCHPCNLLENQEEIICFDFIEEEISETEFWNKNEYNMKKIEPRESDKWSYYCFGQIESIHPVIANCGSIKFSLGDWINDENVINSYVYFVISRLDIVRVCR